MGAVVVPSKTVTEKVSEYCRFTKVELKVTISLTPCSANICC